MPVSDRRRDQVCAKHEENLDKYRELRDTSECAAKRLSDKASGRYSHDAMLAVPVQRARDSEPDEPEEPVLAGQHVFPLEAELLLFSFAKL